MIRFVNVLRFGRAAGIAFAAIAGFTGCQREQVTSYQIPKEDYSVKVPSMAGPSSDPHTQARPQLKWTAPEGWTERPGQMGVVGFRINSGEDKFADVRVIPLRAGPEIEKRSVNIWREELGLSELPLDQIEGEEFEMPGAHTHLYDMTSEEPKVAGKFKARTTGAAVEKDGTLWFVKMIGEESVVASQQEQFRQFLKSLRFEAPSAGEASSGGADVDWKTPEGWTKEKAGQMVLAAYKASKDGKSADITVSSFAGATGGVFANVNRWRGQVGAAPITEADLPRETKQIDLANGTKATVVDVKATRRLYGLIVPRGEKTWFYKMVGDSEVVEEQIAKLNEFAATAH